MNLDQWIIFFAEYFPYLAALGFVYFAFKHRGAFYERLILAAEGIVAAVVARICVEVIRFFIHRPRPFVDNHAIVALLNETSYSFPSGHAAFFFALGAVVYIYNKRWGMWFFVASTLIGIARVMAGVHYPTDILGGAVLGIATGWLIHRLFLLFSRK